MATNGMKRAAAIVPIGILALGLAVSWGRSEEKNSSQDKAIEVLQTIQREINTQVSRTDTTTTFIKEEQERQRKDLRDIIDKLDAMKDAR